jgi:hypothetical protein
MIIANSHCAASGNTGTSAQLEEGTLDAYGPELLCGLGGAQILIRFCTIEKASYASAYVEKQ